MHAVGVDSIGPNLRFVFKSRHIKVTLFDQNTSCDNTQGRRAAFARSKVQNGRPGAKGGRATGGARVSPE